MKWLYNIAGCTCVGLAFLGLFLPLLPTTPFLLLAAYFFSKGSARLHYWLITHRRLGPIIRDWHENRVIRPGAKRTAAVMIILIMSPTLFFFEFPLLLKATSAVIGLGVILLIHSYPSFPPEERR